jgi:hypothetical protein
MIYITKNNFTWLDVTGRCDDTSIAEALFSIHTIYTLFDDESESLIESMDELEYTLKLGLKVVVPVGFLPTKNLPYSIKDSETVVKDGYLYARVKDLSAKRLGYV